MLVAGKGPCFNHFVSQKYDRTMSIVKCMRMVRLAILRGVFCDLNANLMVS